MAKWAALEQIDAWVDEGIVRGAAIAVWHQGGIVASRTAGTARDDTPVTDETLFALASVSKPITATAIMAAVDDGLLTLDTPVASVVPEFGEVDDPLADDVLPQLEALRDRVTLRHLLSHTSGLPENIGVKRMRVRDLPSLEIQLDLMCGMPLQSAPGEVLRYSNVGVGVASRMLERAIGRAFIDTLRSRVLQPLRLDGIVAQPTGGDRDRLAFTDDAAQAGTPAESYNSIWWQEMAIPWGGFFGTPRALATFAATFFSGNEQVLTPESTAEMVTDQTGGVPGGVASAGVHWNHGAWGLGWEVAANKRHHWTGSLRSPRTFCHWGQSGTLVWGDPDRELAIAVFGNRAVHTPWPLRPPRWAKLSDDIIHEADQHSR
jgi:CubicO group peptidase (beta-lactamase class C family)